MLYLWVIIQMIGGVFALSIAGTFIVAPILTLTVKGLPFLTLARITFVSFLKGNAFEAMLYGIYILALGKRASDVPGLSILVTFGLIGWFIATDIKLARVKALSAG